MKIVYQFELLSEEGFNAISAPANAEVLTAQMLEGRLVLFVLADPTRATVLRRFRIVSSGFDVQNEKRAIYRATVQLTTTPRFGDDRTKVLHIFEEMP